MGGWISYSKNSDTVSVSSASSSSSTENGNSDRNSVYRQLRLHKMVFVANMSLKMGAGKLAAQVGHATLGLYCGTKNTKQGHAALKNWDYNGAMKVVVKGQSMEQLHELFRQANSLQLYTYMVHDAGHTQIPSGSLTILGIFGPIEEVNKVTGKLKLL